ncbi:MAG TPA: pyruvate, phosphate dikinase [Sandaracinaceae bacterium LLY-WYZ-13_1]|nr:pyruvate, phosphate dikinase [Sandaracinaceae bacterium LLY-WYZ-13_1]
MATRYVHRFGADIGDAEPKKLLGGKGAGLSEMTRLEIPVPPGFTIDTNACRAWMDTEGEVEGLDAQVAEALAALEADVGRALGDAGDPLLVSVRSGAAISMPGMMDTILNLGLNDETVEGLAAKSGDRRFAFDAYRRLLDMYGDVVLGVEREHFEGAMRALKGEKGDPDMDDTGLDAEALEELCRRYRAIIDEKADRPFPQDPRAQLDGAIAAVFDSWDNPRARRYRKMNEIPESLGTAVNVQAMVFGNMGDDCGSGVLFTRSPSTGARDLFGEFLQNAQGEDVVAGIRTPRPLTKSAARRGQAKDALEDVMPGPFETLSEIAARLEKHYRDMQDIEFTIEKGRTFILQTRTGKRTAHAAVRIAVEMVDEGLIDRDTAVLRVPPDSLEQLLHATLPEPGELEKRGVKPIAKGLPASPGAAVGQIVMDADEAEKLAEEGKAVVLVRRETSPEDIHGMKAAKGIVTATGGMTSHAAVVARGLGKCCVAGASGLDVDYAGRKVRARSPGGETVELEPGELITLDGTHGLIYRGELDVGSAATIPELERLMEWADGHRRLRIRANADTPSGARTARSYGAEGIGLCRTEHMFFAQDRLEAVRCMVLAGPHPDVREKWLAKLEPMQREDFVEIFRAMDGLPVTIRLLDWPLHEFLPREARDLQAVSQALGVDVEVVRRRALELHETNPMLGHRGVRVGLTSPEIYRMQTRAILHAAAECAAEGVDVRPEIMLPVVALAEELAALRPIVEEAAREALASKGAEVDYLIGTMIELPRACLVAGALAEHAEFFSFGTNDLTQTTLGISRDDAGRFLPFYVHDPGGLMEADPFARLDVHGVGELVRTGTERGRARREALKVGLCGEHGGDPRSIDFCHRIGLDYVSCSPPRLPIARLAAAQAAIRAETSDGA